MRKIILIVATNKLVLSVVAVVVWSGAPENIFELGPSVKNLKNHIKQFKAFKK